MDTEAVRLFVESAERLNISAAGRALGLAPAVASARLAKLERELGADLLHRSTRRVALSVEGSEFLPHARELVAAADAARAAMGQIGVAPTGTVRFTAPSSFAQLYLAPLLPEWVAAHPGLGLDLRLSDNAFDLIEGSYDLALRNAQLPDSSLRGRKLAEDTRVLCASPACLARHGTPSSVADLPAHPLIAFGRRRTWRLQRADGSGESFDPEAAGCQLRIDDGHSQKLATLAGAGISVNSLWSAHRELASGELVRVLPEFRVDPGVALWLVYPQSNVLSAKVRVLIDFLVERLGPALAGIGDQSS